MEFLAQVLLLLGVTVAVVVLFQRLHIPTSLGYLLVGVILGPHTIGPIVDLQQFERLAEFGVVFLLFTIGLNYSLPQLHALRHQVLGLGTAQVVLSTLLVAMLLWLLGVPFAMAFVIGAVFAQSSSTLIGSILAEQGEESSPHGRLGLAMSVFQDVTAVPFLVVIPVLGAAVGFQALASALGIAVGKAVLAFAVVYLFGRWLLRPLFHQVSIKRSAEVFTLAVLLVALLASWATNALGLSLAFGAFLAGMMLGDTEFRLQVESSIRPFRDVLLGLFFIGIGMLFNPLAVFGFLHWALLGALLILLSKTLIVAGLVRWSGVDAITAWSTGLLVSVGGEFGFALLAIAISSGVVDSQTGQIALASVLLAMVGGSFLIRFNQPLATLLTGSGSRESPVALAPLADAYEKTVLIAGYGRVGHTVAVLLQNSGVPFIAFDSDPQRVAQGRADGHQVLYGDVSDPGLLATVQPERMALVIVTVGDPAIALRTVTVLRNRCPQVPIIARARDLRASAELTEAGAAHAHPELIEASLRLGATALRMLRMPSQDVDLVLQGIRDWDYQEVLEEAVDGQTPRAEG
jgi:CPA2 family monovalent cation:H+ antiporter-2